MTEQPQYTVGHSPLEGAVGSAGGGLAGGLGGRPEPPK